jgi:hypothetical protein
LIKNNNKIDIDGYELEALQGMNNILKNLSPYEKYNYKIIKILDTENYIFKK